MVKSSKGFRSRSRGTFTKEVREKGLPAITRYLRAYAIGEKVIVRIEPSDAHGQPHPRYQGRTCTVIARSGKAYRLEFLDGGKRKELVVAPIHLAPASPRADG